jgi:exopolyphosphatase/guanosine-5'-triphosphate,3'-diphosphate pyrophosphatase
MCIGPAAKYYAAIDLGSNSCRLLITKATPQGLQHVESYSRIIRLSEGLSRTGYIGEAAMSRALFTLRQSVKRLRNYSSVKLRCVATEVCRRANNTAEVFSRIYRETALRFTVISEKEEAYLTAKGVSGLLDQRIPYAIIFDIGGGSTEVVLLHLVAGQEPTVLDWMSLPVGVVSIAESINPENARNYFQLTAMIRYRLERFGEPHHLREKIEQDKVQLIGTSGTATTAAAIHLGLRFYDREKVDGCILSFSEIENVIKTLQMMSMEERARHPCIGPERSDLVLGGMAIFEGLSAAWPIGWVRVADRGLRDGMVQTLYHEDLAQRIVDSGS